MSGRSYLSIGDVLSLLREEFPDVTISKIRFLESQGLVDPERSPSGYRKFYDQDVARLRWVLRKQRDQFLPLRVIRDRLAAAGNGVPPDDDPADAAVEEASSAAWRAEPGAAAVPVGAHALAAAQPTATATSPAYGTPATRAGADAGAGGGNGGNGGAGGANGAGFHGENGAGSSVDSAEAHASARGRDETDPLRGRVQGPAHAGTQSLEDVVTESHGKAQGACATPSSGGEGSGREAGQPRATAVAGQGADAAAPRPQDAPDVPPPATPPGTPAVPPPTTPVAPAAPPPASGSSPPPAAASLHASLTGVSLTLAELCAASGLSSQAVAALEGCGLLAPMSIAGGNFYDEEALTVAKLAVAFERFGIEPRHLRLFRNAADREVGLIEQVVAPLLRQRNPEARQRAIETATELAGLGQSLRAALVRSELHRQLGT